MSLVGTWSNRFIWTAIIQGAIVTALTIMLTAFVISSPKLLITVILARGSSGYTEIAALAGMGLYLVVDVIVTAVTSQFHHHFEVRLGRKYIGISS